MAVLSKDRQARDGKIEKIRVALMAAAEAEQWPCTHG